MSITKTLPPISKGIWHPARLDARILIILSLLFTFALILRLWFIFGEPHAASFNRCDASEYLRNASAISHLTKLPPDIWPKCLAYLTGTATTNDITSIRGAFKILQEMHQSGPVFPTFLVLTYVIFGHPFDASNSVFPLLVQSMLSALTCVLIALTGMHAWNRKVGLIAGFFAAIYPAFIVNSERLYSESFATFLTVVMLYLVVRGFNERGNGITANFIAGFVMACLQLTRSATFLLSLTLLPLMALQQWRRKRWLSLVSILLGFALVLIPSITLQSLTFGKWSLIIDRVGHYNFFTGNNVNTSGWLSYPYPDGRGIEEKSFGRLAAESFKTSPNRFLKLMLDKPVRLLKFPWNDFRVPIGPITNSLQVAIHQQILLLAAVGIILYFLVNPGTAPPNWNQLGGRGAIIFVLLFHSVYLLFITVPRYNLTAMPCLILLAASGLYSFYELLRLHFYKIGTALVLSVLSLYIIARLDLQTFIAAMPQTDPRSVLFVVGVLKAITVLLFAGSLCWATSLTSGYRKAARLACAILSLLLLPVLVLPVRAHGRWTEFQTILDRPGQTITEQIVVPLSSLAKLKNRQCFVMVDSDGLSQLQNGLTLSVNGTELSGPFIPGLSLIQDFSLFKHHGESSFSLKDEKQLNSKYTQDKDHVYLECEYIFGSLADPADLSNQDLRQWFLVPIPRRVFADAKPLVSLTLSKTSSNHTRIFGSAQVNNTQLELPSPERCSWEKCFYGVENDKGLSDARYDTLIKMTDSKKRSHSLLRLLTPATKDCTSNLYTRVKTLFLQKDRTEFKAALPSFKGQEMWIFRTRGRVRLPVSNSTQWLTIAIEGENERGRLVSYQVPWVPRKQFQPNYIEGKEPTIKYFDFSFPFVPGCFPTKAQQIVLTASSTPVLHEASTNTSAIKPILPKIEDLHLELMSLSGNPLMAGYEVF